jgi:hypothetical protein
MLQPTAERVADATNHAATTTAPRSASEQRRRAAIPFSGASGIGALIAAVSGDNR